jgi:hypothetical protein
MSGFAGCVSFAIENCAGPYYADGTLNPYEFQRGRRMIANMKRDVSSSILASLYAHFRVWRDRRGRRHIATML